MIVQKTMILSGYRRGYHIITREIEKELPELPETGLLHIFMQHTSAGVTLNENADPSVRHDFRSFFDELIPENHPVYTHTFEGTDDMPAHLKSSLIGPSVTVPITNHRLNLGTWQGVYYCEFRDHPGNRRLVLTIYS